MKKTSIALLALLSMASVANADAWKFMGPDGGSISVQTDRSLSDLDWADALSAARAAYGHQMAGKAQAQMGSVEPAQGTLAFRVGKGSAAETTYSIGDHAWADAVAALNKGDGTLVWVWSGDAAGLPVYNSASISVTGTASR